MRCAPISPAKRLFDVLMALLLGLLLAPLMLVLAWQIRLQGDGQVFFRAERMAGPNLAFDLWKFRSMRPPGINDGPDSGATGAQKESRITPLGAFMRARRLDELPQLWNILRGDIIFVGPRPPLREYVERFPELYSDVLQCRPGVTGLATLVYHRHEERLLHECTDAMTTDSTYARRCIPAKARIDLIYGRHASMLFDLWIIWQTLLRVYGRRPARAAIVSTAQDCK